MPWTVGTWSTSSRSPRTAALPARQRPLRVAQPSLSLAIRSIEREVGAVLFHRLSRGVTLTAAGEALLRPAQQVLRDFAAARAAVQMVSDVAAGRLDIVAQTTLAVHPLAGLVGAFRQAHPGAAVVDADRRLLGVVPRAAILSAMAGPVGANR